MQLTTHTDYALRLLIYLAISEQETPATIQEIALRYGVSVHHIAKVAQTLVQLGYIRSLRGRGGGLVLLRNASEIRVGTVVRETENLRLLECFGPDSSCPIDPACTLKMILGEALEAFLGVLDRYTLTDLVNNGGELRRLLSQQTGLV